jgi:RHH-type proline utilization regulon transcriptional repressor/proline dehydrogenase/delta 1-pyrroline-5-carboxylate dehydrogenase
MEEYRDLPMTVAAFKSVLAEPEFAKMNAGIVIQAYLPESHQYFEELVEFSKQRFSEHGSPIKIRLVKGANLAMESAEAELHGWNAAPYKTKSDVDASYARLIDTALRLENSQAVRIGIASHNLFHVTWAIEVARERGVLAQLDIEMLEGMANSEALTLTRSGHPVLLYAPVTKKSDFAAAVAYLVRRLDENTSDENYLKATFEISKNPKKFDEQLNRFLNSVKERHKIFTGSYRHQELHYSSNSFENQWEEDPTNPNFVKAMQTEIAKVKSANFNDIPMVVGGEVVTTSDFENGTDPSENSSVWYLYNVGTKENVDTAVQTSKTALTSWSAKSIEERKEILFRVADVMHNQTAQTIAVMSRDAGKTVAEADPEISEAIDFARFYATSAKNFENSSPLGTVLIVPPWNFPYAIPAGGVLAALAAGNTVILKPAPETVATAWVLANQIWEGGVPKDVLQFLPMRDDENGKYLVTHPEINGVILTGAFDTAAMFTNWNPEINLMAETSGKNAMLITAYADIDIAVKDLVQSAFGHAGQKCSASSVAIVDSTIYNNPSFVSQLSDAANSLSVGAGWDFSTTVGPVIRKPESNLQRALTTLEPGESWLVEPKQLDQAGNLWRPGVKLGVKAGSWSHQNEWFGPVLAVIESPDFQTGLAWQNQTEFGLTAGIQSLDETECATWINGMRAGNLYVNRGTTGAIVNRQPFGGWKKSSVGPNAKAGGLNYVNTLRDWPKVTEVPAALYGARNWWEKIGSQAIDRSGLTIEKNYQRYRRYDKPILVVSDETTANEELVLIQKIADLMKVKVAFASVNDSIGDVAKVRWLAAIKPPVSELLARGISVDHRPVAQRGDIEAPRWLLEQSVAITFHRYGNVNGGPKPECKGLI